MADSNVVQSVGAATETLAGNSVVVVVPPDDVRRTVRKTVLELGAEQPADVVIDLRLLEDVTDPVVGLLVGMKDLQLADRHRLTLVCRSGSATERTLDGAGLRRQLVNGDH